MPLDISFAQILEALTGLTAPDLEDPLWTPPSELEIRDVVVQAATASVRLRVYRPGEVRNAPLMWLHGGGFSRGDLDMPEAHAVAAELSHRAACVVVSVDYRLATDTVHYPAPVDDAMAAWDWLVAQDSPHGAPALGGASAGAAIAVSAALRVRDDPSAIQPRALLLAYPFVHFPVPALPWDFAKEMDRVPPSLRFTASSIAEMVRTYVGGVHDVPRAALPGAADLRGLPPTTVIVSEYDDLRPSAELLIDQLEEAEVQVTQDLAGAPHGHLNWPPTLSEVSRSLDVFANALISRIDDRTVA